MKIKKKLNQHRRDFTAIYACELCQHEVERSGYDDTHFHEVVIRQWPCPNCLQVSPPESRPDEPRHHDGEVL